MTGGAGSYGLTISNTSATTRLTTSFGGSSLGFRVNAAGADQLTVSGSAVNIPLTTSASSSTVGALTIGNGTAATNVAIGGGKINAGSTEASTGVGTGALQVAGGIYAGAASMFGSTVTTLSSSILAGSAGNARLGSVAGRVDLDPTNGRVAIYGASAVDRYLDILRADGTTVGVQLLSNGTSTFLGGATFAGAVTTGGNLSVAGATAAPAITVSGVNANASPIVYLTSGLGGGSQQQWSISTNATNAGEFVVRDNTATTDRITVAKTTGAMTINGSVTTTGPLITASTTLSGAGAIPITTSLVKFTSTGAANALTLANGVDGQRLTIVHDVKGTLGTGVLTPTTKTGFSTVTFNNAGDTVSLVYVTTRGWMVTGSYLATIA